jgi:hypothetical protein
MVRGIGFSMLQLLRGSLAFLYAVSTIYTHLFHALSSVTSLAMHNHSVASSARVSTR